MKPKILPKQHQHAWVFANGCRLVFTADGGEQFRSASALEDAMAAWDEFEAWNRSLPPDRQRD